MEKTPGGRGLSREDQAKIISHRQGVLGKRLADVVETAAELVSKGEPVSGLQEQYSDTRARIAEVADLKSLLGLGD